MAATIARPVSLPRLTSRCPYCRGKLLVQHHLEKLSRANNARVIESCLAQPAPGGADTTPPAGLLNLPLTNGGTVSGDLDAVVDAIATVEDANGAASHIVCSPSGWAELSKMKTDSTDSNVSLVGAGTVAPTRTLLSVPVVVSNAMPDATMLVLDKSTVLSVYGQVQVATSTDFYFGSDNVVLRATFRFGAKIADPERVVKLTVASGDS